MDASKSHSSTLAASVAVDDDAMATAQTIWEIFRGIGGIHYIAAIAAE